MADYPHPESLFSPAQLARLLAGPDRPVIVDCRFDLARPDAGGAAYQAGHIPRAWYAHLDHDLAGPRVPGSGRHPLPDPEGLARLFARWGVEPATQVVAYDDSGGAIAARLWWLLRWMGHRRVGLLDGGWAAWIAAGLPVSVDTPAPATGVFHGSPGQMPVADTAAIEAHLGDRRFLILDARSGPRYRGETEPLDPVAGHVPGAVNWPYQTALDAAGHFREPADIRAALQATLAGRANGDVVVMCGSGVTACHALFAMELAGLPGGRLYPGSWSEWIADPGRPVARA